MSRGVDQRDDPSVDQIIRSYIRNKPSENHKFTSELLLNATYLRESLDDRPSGNDSPIAARRPGTSHSTQSRIRHSEVGDLLQTHKHRFTEEKPFSPRTIRSNASSKLRGLRCYNPPVRTSRVKAANAEQLEPERIRPVSALATKSDLNDATRISKRPSIHSYEGAFESPNKLDLLQSAGLGKASAHQPSQFSNPERTHTPQPTSLTQNLDWVDQWIQSLPASENTSDNLQLSKKLVDDGVQARIDTWRERINDKHKALLYLNFIEAVTNDVLARGIFTDRCWLDRRDRATVPSTAIRLPKRRNIFRLRSGGSKLVQMLTNKILSVIQEQLQQAADQLRTQLRITDDIQLEEPHHTSEDHRVPQEPEVKSTNGDETGRLLSSRQSGGTDFGYCTSPLDPLLAASPSLSTRPPVAPIRDNRKPGSPSMVKHSISKKCTESKRKTPEVDAPKRTTVGAKESSPKVESNIETGAQRYCGENPKMKKLPGSDQSNEGHTHSTNSDAHWSEGASPQDHSYHEDTLNDPTTMPNMSSSVQPADLSELADSCDLGDEQPQSYSFQFEDDELGKSPENKPDILPTDLTPADEPFVVSRTKHTRVTFASEAEFFSIPTGNDSTTSLSSLTNLTRLMSPDLMSPSKSELDASSLQAIAEGDSNITVDIEQDKEHTAAAYNSEILLKNDEFSSG
ncbi:hypothetical protein T265_02819 [Opisthorchis viverrini]|uniref:Uncharacterized protein n=1 Tax=Opisthorchis viverrini TaxID=6198 RepID=A0A074ZUI5_OPIVI|nr:hypothetical protein T265_02819 [Opisthorchis viverrini]KER30776.1 hypothetical protein T265_02819 [Opisthorchis viverrini]